jgi:hypothetical protein
MSDYYRTHFSPQQLKAVNDTIDTYKEGNIKWLILLAQMQSGKTDAFLLIACEMIRHGLIDSIVIFSGSAENDLCEQLKEKTIKNGNSDYWRKYENYIGEFIDEDPRDFANEFREILTSDFEPKLHVVWGTQKSSYSGPNQKTLFIWEEAHFAQNKDQGPAKFLKNLEISADGSQSFLEEKGNFVLTVSATPFSELSDREHLHQSKEVIKMKPGDGYIGVGYLRANNRIRKWKTVEEGLNEACSLPRYTKKWAIIRVTDNLELVETTMKLRGWKCEKYDSSIPLSQRKSGDCKDSGFLAWKKMAAGRAPEEDTVIIIKGMCRMGKNINKTHLLFVFETSKNPASDTILQGLLGRVCGYGNSETIVFLSSKVVDGDELDRYIELWESDRVSIIPKKANNLNNKSVSITDPIIPIVVKRDRNQFPSNDHRSDVINDVYDAFLNHPERIVNKNPNIIYDEIRDKYLSTWNENKSKLFVNSLDKGKKTRGKDKALLIKNAFENNEAKYFGSGGGIDSEGTEIKIWVNKNIDELDTEVFYVMAATIHVNRREHRIPKTTKREVFAHRLEDGSEIVCNGGMPKLLSPSTATDWTAMCDELSDFVEVSRDKAYFPGVISLGTNEDGQPNGIIVTDKVLKELIEGGRIFKTIKNMGATLKVTKSRGPIPKALKDKNLIKLASITWIWN